MAKRMPPRQSRQPRVLVLARRLLSSSYGPGSVDEIQILPDRLPGDLPIDLPLPDRTTIIGSLVRGDQGAQIVLDVAQPAEAILAFYRSRLEPAGWHEVAFPMRPGGFGGATAATFCQSARGPSLSVTALEMGDAPTDVRLNLQTDPRHSPCAMLRQPLGLPSFSVPSLPPPAGAKMRGGGGWGGGGGSWQSTATLQTDLDAAALVVHYNRQLKKAGWQLLDHGQAGSAAWSTWRFRDAQGDAWAGTLLILGSVATSGERFAYLFAELLS